MPGSQSGYPEFLRCSNCAMTFDSARTKHQHEARCGVVDLARHKAAMDREYSAIEAAEKLRLATAAAVAAKDAEARDDLVALLAELRDDEPS